MTRSANDRNAYDDLIVLLCNSGLNVTADLEHEIWDCVNDCIDQVIRESKLLSQLSTSSWYILASRNFSNNLLTKSLELALKEENG